jgi:hypothetical protein
MLGEGELRESEQPGDLADAQFAMLELEVFVLRNLERAYNQPNERAIFTSV